MFFRYVQFVLDLNIEIGFWFLSVFMLEGVDIQQT